MRQMPRLHSASRKIVIGDSHGASLADRHAAWWNDKPAGCRLWVEPRNAATVSLAAAGGPGQSAVAPAGQRLGTGAGAVVCDVGAEVDRRCCHADGDTTSAGR